MKNKKFLLVFIICIVVLFFKAHTIIADQWDENDCNAGKDYGWVYPPFVEDPSNIAHYIYDHNTKGRQQTGTISFCYKKNAACPSSTHECRNYTSENGNLQGFCNGSAPGFFWCNSGVCCKASDKILDKSEKLYFDPEVGIPGFRKQQKIDGDLMGKFAKQLYIYLLGLSGIVAVLVLILAGFQWVMAGGNQNKIGEAKQRIINAITGLVLLSCSYLILYTINPKLVEIKTIEIKKVKPIAVGNFDKQQFFADRRSALDKNISCNDDAECTTHNSEWICAPKNSNSPNVKICMNKSVDNGQCDEDSDCYPGLACTNFQCTIPPELSCAHKNSWTRCFLKLYNPDESDGAPQVVAGYCDGSICRSCLKKNAKCGVSTVGVIPNIFDIIDRFTGESHVYGNAKCEGVKVGNPQVGICGNINKKLTNSKYFQALPEEYKQKSKGSCEYGSINGLTLEYYCVDHK